VPSPYFKPTSYLVKEWPEIFEDMQINTPPVAYLEYVHLEFANGRVWQIDIKSQLQEQGVEIVATRLLDTMSEYREEIVKFDFKIDIEKLKKDIRDSSKKIL
jgi:hypothetical protein